MGSKCAANYWDILGTGYESEANYLFEKLFSPKRYEIRGANLSNIEFVTTDQVHDIIDITGFPYRLAELVSISSEYKIPLVGSSNILQTHRRIENWQPIFSFKTNYSHDNIQYMKETIDDVTEVYYDFRYQQKELIDELKIIADKRMKRRRTDTEDTGKKLEFTIAKVSDVEKLDIPVNFLRINFDICGAEPMQTLWAETNQLRQEIENIKLEDREITQNEVDIYSEKISKLRTRISNFIQPLGKRAGELQKILTEPIAEAQQMLQELAEQTEGNYVYVGNKAPMSYVIAVITEFETGNERVTLRARGRAISRAVDAAEIVRNRFMEDVTIESISLDTEEIESEEGGTRNVSSIDITLTKN